MTIPLNPEGVEAAIEFVAGKGLASVITAAYIEPIIAAYLEAERADLLAREEPQPVRIGWLSAWRGLHDSDEHRKCGTSSRRPSIAAECEPVYVLRPKPIDSEAR